MYNPVSLACKQLVPPTEEKVPCNELEPWGERVAYISIIRTMSQPQAVMSAYPAPQTSPEALPCQRTCDRESRLCSESPSRPQSKRGYNQLKQARDQPVTQANKDYKASTFMLSPHAIRWGKVVYPCQVLELIHRCLATWDTELMFQLP